MVKLLKALGRNEEKALRLASKADFVGVMLEHGDEHHLYYFAINKGKSSPKEILDLNLADLSYDLEAPLAVNDFFLGAEARKFDVYEEIIEILNSFEN